MSLSVRRLQPPTERAAGLESTDQAAEPSRCAPDRWQFSLLSLLELITAAAVVSTLAAALGPGTLPISIGLALAWLNLRGGLARWQSPALRTRWFYAAWMLIGVSLWLPAVEGCQGSRIVGWRAAYHCAVAEVGAVQQCLRPGESSLDDYSSLVTVTLLNLANVLMVLSPLILRRLERGKGQYLIGSLTVVTVAVWVIPLDDPHPYLVGYYVWALGFALVQTSCRIRGPTFAAMTGLAAVLSLSSCS